MRNPLTTSSVTTAAAFGLVFALGSQVPAVAHEIAHKISGSTIKPNTITGKQVKEATLATVPRAAVATRLPALKWHPLALANGWTSGATTYGTEAPAYAVDGEGFVRLRGVLQHPAGPFGAPFTVPSAIRPAKTVYEPIVLAGGSIGRFEVTHTGITQITDASAANATTFTSLNGVSWEIG